MMDSVLSLDTHSNGFAHSPSTISSTTTPSHPQPSLPNLLVPKPEPFWDTDDNSEELSIFSEFNRVSKLFRLAFEGTNVAVPPDFFGPVNVACPPDHGTVPHDPNPAVPSNLAVATLDPNSAVPLPDLNSGADLNSPSAAADDLQAIVPVPPAEGTVAVVPRRKQSRLKELVRIINLPASEESQYRERMRRTRLLYDSLRVLSAVEEEKRAAAVAAEEEERQVAAVAAAETMPVEGTVETVLVEGNAETMRVKARRLRGDLRAAALMRERGLWLNRDKRIVGAIPGIMVGDLFLFRMELCVLGLHGQIQAGIDFLPASMSSTGEPIATSVIVSGGYEDDLDDGEVIVYTGHGGQGKNSSRQVAHQKLEAGNLALERSMHYGLEVRVIRGMKYEGSAAGSGKVYVYDGLYRIVDSWFEVGKSGFGVFKFKLWRIEGQTRMGSAIFKDARNIKRSGLDVNHVCCLSADMSNKKENVPVRLFNDIDDDQGPLCYEYLARTSFPQFVFHQTGKATGCDCVDGCGDGCFCAMKNGGEFPYTLQGHLVRGKPLIFECGPFCACPPHCRNRVAQKGMKNRLEVFRSQQTAWGVRSLDLIQAGAFICEFAGVVLTREQAELLRMNGDALIYPNRFSERWAEWGDLSHIYPDYVRPSYPSVPPLDFSLDVSTMRNVACYMSHSSTPNVLVQFLLYDHNNLMFPHLMLFAMENIPPMRELSLDYGVADEWTGKLSICN